LDARGDDPSRPQRAERIIQDLQDLSARAKAAGAPEALEAGAWADFTAATVLLDVLDRRDQAMALLAELPQRWPGAAVLAQALALHAAKLLEGGKVEEAVAAVEALGQDHPAQALVLGRRLLADMAERGTSTQPARSWTDGRVRLAAYCYGRCDAADPAEKVAFGLLYGQALLDAGRAAEAMEILSTCRTLAETETAQRREQIDAELSSHLAAVDKAGGDAKTLRAMAGQLLGQLDAAKLTDGRAAFAVRGAMAELDAASTERRQGLVEPLASAVRDGYRQLAQARTQALAAPGDILMALARAYAETGRLDQAADLYGRLTEGLDPATQKEAYWQSELGYCRCILASRREDPRAMKSLAVRIAQLRLKDPQLGGLAEGFAAIESEARTEDHEAPTRPAGAGGAR
jgi:tetratricopeptide (TPR) repeat protein